MGTQGSRDLSLVAATTILRVRNNYRYNRVCKQDRRGRNDKKDHRDDANDRRVNAEVICYATAYSQKPAILQATAERAPRP